MWCVDPFVIHCTPYVLSTVTNATVTPIIVMYRIFVCDAVTLHLCREPSARIY